MEVEFGDSATDVPPDVVQSDYQCGFCLGDVTEPRALPCAHVFCTTCIKQNFNPLTSTTQCKICKPMLNFERKEHGDIDTDALFAVGIELVSIEELAEKPPCDVCPEEPKPAKNYCIDCGARMCEEDTKIHDDSRKRWKKREHMTIPIEKYVAMPRKYQKRLCEHHQRKLSSTCSTCFALFCSQCYTRVKEPCTAEKGKLAHDVVPIHEISATLKTQISELLKSLHEKMSTGDNNVKGAWKGLSEAEDNVKDIPKEIERHEEKLIQTVRDECRRCKDEFDQHIEESTMKIEEFTTKLDVMRTLLAELTVEGQHVSSTKHDVDIILLFNDLQVKMEEKLADKTMEKTITLPDVFLVGGHPVVDADLRLSYTKAQPAAATESTSINYKDLKRKMIENDSVPSAPAELLETVVAFDGFTKSITLLQTKVKEIQKELADAEDKSTVDCTAARLIAATASEYGAAFARHDLMQEGVVYQRYLEVLQSQCSGSSEVLLETNRQSQVELTRWQVAAEKQITAKNLEIQQLKNRYQYFRR